MTLLVILAAVFIGVAIMVVVGEKYGKPMDAEEQSKYAKVTRILVFLLLIVAILKLAFF